MGAALDVLEVVQPFVYGAIGVVALVHWVRHRGTSAAWIALAFGSLAAIVVLGVLLPQNSDDPTVEWVQKFEIALLVFFPYFLFRFTATFGRPRAWLEVLVAVLTGASAVAILPFDSLPDEGEPQGGWWIGYIVLLLVQWVTVSAVVAVRLWRAGRGQPNVAKRRMQMLSAASVLLAAALVVAGAGSGDEENEALQLVTGVVALASALLFLLGFAPPAIVRLVWRRPEEARLNQAELRLMERLESPQDVADVLLPEVVRLAGGGSAALLDVDGRTLASIGDMTAGRPISVPMHAGRLVVTASPYAPYFGREENQLLLRLAVLADLALARVRFYEQDRRSQEQLLEAQRIAQVGSWDWDVEADRTTWSEELYRIYGVSPGEFEASYDAFLERVHPEDRAFVHGEVTRALEERTGFVHEQRIVRPNGEVRILLERAHVVVDDEGKPVRMIGTGQDITQQKREERSRDQFIANAAHELRTPLAAIVGLIEVLSSRRTELSSDRIEQAFDALKRSSDRIAALVNSLLDLTRLQQRPGVDLRPVRARDAIEDAVRAVPPPAGTSVEVDAEDASVLVDPDRLDQALTNLLTNAYKYGNDRVEISAQAQNGSVVIAVSDNGPGVDAAFLPDLFEPFARSRTASTLAEGSGLGLAIARRAIEACGGTLWYEAGAGVGARFCVRLPAA